MSSTTPQTLAAKPATALTYDVDLAHSRAEFAVRHMMFATVKGTVAIKSATVVHDPADLRNTTIEAVLDPATIETGAGQRDDHLRSPDFFDAKSFPAWTFRSTLVEPEGDDAFSVHGDLTLRGETHPVTLKVEKLGEGRDPWGNAKVGLVATTQIDRTKWGLTWNQALETGGVLVSEKVKIELHLQLSQRK
jgi:polyisoprenoid-binding protein YceI